MIIPAHKSQKIGNDKKNICKPVDMVRQSYVAKIITNFFNSLKNPIPVNSTGKQLDILASYFLQKYGCHTSLKNYQGFPANISVGINHVVAHGIPNDTPLKDDDIITLDIVAHTTRNNGKMYYADMARSFLVGKAGQESKKLIVTAWNVSRAGVLATKSGNTLRNIAYAVQEEAYKHNVHVYNQFTGHGIGNNIHEFPQVRYDSHTPKIEISAGMVLCIEPIVSLLPQKVTHADDGTYLGAKKHKCAVFEHMVAVFASHSVVLSYGGIYPEEMPQLKVKN